MRARWKRRNEMITFLKNVMFIFPNFGDLESKTSKIARYPQNDDFRVFSGLLYPYYVTLSIFFSLPLFLPHQITYDLI